ncbi:MAG: hypothetical protein GSR76_04475 [Desulfurococcales archaeon]|nr:hypothetical protein [Desulfurococcales archaeon]
MPTVVKFRLSKNAVRKLFGSEKASVSKGLEEVLDRYSEKVEDDVLEELLRERR